MKTLNYICMCHFHLDRFKKSFEVHKQMHAAMIEAGVSITQMDRVIRRARVIKDKIETFGYKDGCTRLQRTVQMQIEDMQAKRVEKKTIKALKRRRASEERMSPVIFAAP